MQIRVLYFSRIRESVGTSAETFDVGDGATIGEAITQVFARHPAIADHDASMLVTKNEEWSDRAAALSDGDVIGLMPPVSGG